MLLPYFGPEFIRHFLAKCHGLSSEAEDPAPETVVTDALKTSNDRPGHYCWRYSRSFIVVAQLIRVWLL
jgi:hypothetical protein